jgi:hypothetical protein
MHDEVSCMKALSDTSLTSNVWPNLEAFAGLAIYASCLHVPSPTFSSQLSRAKVLDLSAVPLAKLHLQRLRDCLTSVPHVLMFKLKLLSSKGMILPKTEVAQIICAFEHLEELHLQVTSEQQETVQGPTQSDQVSLFGLVLKHAPQLHILDLSQWNCLHSPQTEMELRILKKFIQNGRHSVLVRIKDDGSPDTVREVIIDAED